MSDINSLSSQILNIYQNPQQHGNKIQIIFDQVSKNEILNLIENYYNNIYILDFTSSFIQQKIENLDPDFIKSIFQQFISKVYIDGKWWRILIERIIPYVQIEQFITQLGTIITENTPKEKSYGPKFALRELVSIILENYKLKNDLYQRSRHLLPKCFYLLNDKDHLQYCIRNHIDDLTKETFEFISNFDLDSKLDIFCEIASRKDNVFHEYILSCTYFISNKIFELLQNNKLDQLRKSILFIQLVSQNHFSLLEAKSIIKNLIVLMSNTMIAILSSDNFKNLNFIDSFPQRIEIYIECIEVCSSISISVADNEERESRYSEELLSFIEVIFKRIILKSSDGELLEFLDYENRNSNNETELDEFISKCIDSCAVICSNSQLYSRLLNIVLRFIVEYFSHLNLIENPVSKESLLISRDLQTFILLISQFVPHFLDSFDDNAFKILEFIKYIGYIIEFNLSKQFHIAHRFHEELLNSCFLTIQIFFPWFRHLSNSDLALTFDLLTKFSKLFIETLFDQQASHKLRNEAANSLMKLVTITRIPSLNELNPIKNLIDSLPNIVKSPQVEQYIDRILVSISNILMNQKDMSEYKKSYESFFKICIADPFHEFATLQSTSLDYQSYNRYAIQHFKILKILTKSMEGVKENLRNTFYENISPLFSEILILIPKFGASPQVLKYIFSFLDCLFRYMSSKLDIEFIDRIIYGFMQILGNSENMIKMMNNGYEKKTVKRFLSLQISVLSNGSRRQRSILPKCIQFIKNVFYPAISRNTSNIVEIKRLYYELLFIILQYHGDSFFDRQTINLSESQNLYFILNQFLESFNTLDIHTLQNSIEFILKLNTSHLLFKRDFFLKEFSSNYIVQLTNVLQSFNHSISSERIINLIYQLLLPINNGFSTYYSKYNIQMLSKLDTHTTLRDQDFQRDMMNWIGK